MLAKFGKFFLTLATVLSINRLTAPVAIAEEIKLDLLCTKFPLNSSCQDYQHDRESNKSQAKEYLLDRDDFCEEYAFNSLCLSEPIEIINLNLKDEEWIRIVKQGNRLQFIHSERTPDDFLSFVTDSAIDLIPLPDLLYILPFGILDLLPLDPNKYNWQDLPVTQVMFKSDLCPLDSCLVSGTKAIDLPADTSFSQGLFTVEYQEQELLRSVTFRIPEDTKVTPIETVSIFVPEIIRRSP